MVHVLIGMHKTVWVVVSSWTILAAQNFCCSYKRPCRYTCSTGYNVCMHVKNVPILLFNYLFLRLLNADRSALKVWRQNAPQKSKWFIGMSPGFGWSSWKQCLYMHQSHWKQLGEQQLQCNFFLKALSFKNIMYSYLCFCMGFTF